MPFRDTKQPEVAQTSYDVEVAESSAHGFLLGKIACCIGLIGFAGIAIARPQLNYRAGASAYSAGDCTTAQEELERVVQAPEFLAFNDVIPRAQAIAAECQSYDDVLGQSQPPVRLARAASFVQQYPNSPLRQNLNRQLEQSLSRMSNEQLAHPETCGNLDNIREARLSPITDDSATASLMTSLSSSPDGASYASLPGLYQACAGLLMQTGRTPEAIAIYEQFMTHFQQHPLYEEVAIAYAKAAVQEAQAQNPNSLPAPVLQAGSSDGQVTLKIRNSSPETMRIIVSGTTPRVEEIPPCPDCQIYSAAAPPEECPEQGPQASYLVKPGQYDVVVKSISSGNVTPFTGSWDLNFSGRYESCFFLSQSSSAG